MLKSPSVVFGDGPLKLDDILALSKQSAEPSLSEAPLFKERIAKGCDFLDRLLNESGVIYGVTTGYGDSCTRAVNAELLYDLPIHLSRFHGCGLGALLTVEQSRAVTAVRLASLTSGMSGVSIALLERLTWFLREDVIPVIPSEGSVGASGDLTPLSYVAAALIGEREVWDRGVRRPTAQALSERGLAPLKLRPKEALAIMNGTAVMTALACLAFSKAAFLSKLTARLTAMTSLALLGNPGHFDEVLFAAKPHPGQMLTASRIRQDLKARLVDAAELSRLQDRYSVRCAPHVIGVLEDMLPSFRQMIETELNSANDNPIIDGEAERVLHGGHFYGGHIAFVMDSLKNLVANLSDLVDRQMASLVDPKFSNGLPDNLSGSKGARASINHGLKAVQIGVSAWTAEALKNTMPASVFSRSTECHNQDKVSMGTISARDCLRVIELTEQAVAGHLVACVQSLRLRLKSGDLSSQDLTEDLMCFMDELDPVIPFIDEDQPLEPVLRHLLNLIGEQHWTLYPDLGA